MIPFAVSLWGGWEFDVAIPPGKVGSNLTNFPLYIDLADAPKRFWNKTNGTDIRAYVGNTQIPCDVVWCDPLTETGRLFVKVPTLASASTTTIKFKGNGHSAAPTNSSTYGRNNVWSDYRRVFLFGQTGGVDRTGNGQAGFFGDPDLFEITATSSTDTDSHQGVCYDGTYYYTTDDNYIRKWDASWTLIDSNSDPVGDTGIVESPAINHCGDPCVVNGRLYIPVEYYSGPSTYSTPYIAVFDASDLSFIEAHDIDAQGHEAASIAYCDRDGLLYIVDYISNNSTIYKYALDGTYIGTLTTSYAINFRQGITWWRGCFWIASDEGEETMRVEYDGTTSFNGSSGAGGIFGQGTSIAWEGLGHTDSGLLQAVDPGATERVDTWEPLDVAKCGGGGMHCGNAATSHATSPGLSHQTTFTMGATINLDSKPGGSQVAVGFVDTDTAASNNNRVILGYRNTDVLAMWDKNNSWQDSTTTGLTLGQSYRIHAVYNGTTNRRIYVNGALGGTDTTVSAIPTGLDTLFIGAEDGDLAEKLDGKVGFVYLRASALSADWLAAEHSNLNNPGGFYSIS